MPKSSGYRAVDTYSLSNILGGAIQNIKTFLNTTYTHLNHEWIILLFIIILCYSISIYISSKRYGIRRFTDVIIGITTASIMLILSYGAYIILKSPPTINARSFMATGVFLAVISIFISRNLHRPSQKILCVPSLILLFYFTTCMFSIGNALNEQFQYNNFRTQILLGDLSRLYPSREKVNNSYIQINNGVKYSKATENALNNYPIIELIMQPTEGGLTQSGLNNGHWGAMKLLNYYDRPQKQTEISDDCTNWHIVLDTYYHTIKDKNNGEKVCVIIK